MPLLNIQPKHPGNPSGTPGSLIRDPELRKQIQALKQTKVLHWLKTEIYSSPEILALVLGFTHRQSLHKTLMAMEERGLIRSGRVAIVGGHQTLWGITEHGQALAFDESTDEAPSDRVFEAGRISALRLRHILGLQKLKWQAIQAGWTGWKNCDRGVKPQKRNQKLKHRPDVLVIDPAGKVVAVELELTFKTIKRYVEEVIPAHARQIYAEENYHHVLWVSPTADDTKRMKNLIWQASEKIKAGANDALKQLEAYKEQTGAKRVFRFGTLEDWTQQWEGRPEHRAANLRAYLWRRFQQATEDHKSLESLVQEEQEWMAATDHRLIDQTLSDYIHAIKKRQQQEDAKRAQEYEEQKRRAEEDNRRCAEQQEAERRANSLVGKVSKLFGK
jgi:hypothetical protein